MCVSAGGKAGLTEGVITAGSGRGFVVECVGERLVVTAPHCLPFLPPAGTLRNPVNFWVPGRLLSLDGRRWFSCTIRHLGGPLWITHAAEGIRNEMSGSPIVSEIGTTIGVVCTAAALWEGGTNPRLTHNLTGWLLRDTL